MSEQTEISPCCVTGHIHEGIPLGGFEILHDTRTYISNPKPPGSGAKQNVVILVPDIFGVDLINAKLVADDWAQNGWKVLLPDFTENGPVDIKYLKTIVPNMQDKAQKTMASKVVDTAQTATNLGPWLMTNREAVAKPKIERFVQAVRADPSTGKIAAVGFCWGGRYSLVLAQEDSPARVDVAIGNHPSGLVNADVESIKSVPSAIFLGTEDDMMSLDALKQVEDIMRGNLGDKFLVKTYKDAVHGFTIRGDTENEKEKHDKEDANNEAIAFVAKHFGKA